MQLFQKYYVDTLQAQAFYDDIAAVEKQLTKMESHLSTVKHVGLLPETLRVQHRQFMVSYTVTES